MSVKEGKNECETLSMEIKRIHRKRVQGENRTDVGLTIEEEICRFIKALLIN